MSENLRLLDDVYKNSVTAIEALTSLYRKTEENQFKDCIFERILVYREIADSAKNKLEEYNFTSSQNFFDRSGYVFAVKIIGYGHISRHRLAKILINGSVEGIYDIIKSINVCTRADSFSRNLAYKLIAAEEDLISKMYEFL